MSELELKWYRMGDKKPVKENFCKEGWIFRYTNKRVSLVSIHGLTMLKEGDYWAIKPIEFKYGMDVSLPKGVVQFVKKIRHNKKNKKKLKREGTMIEQKFEIHKVERGFKIARQVSPVEWHGYLSSGLQYKRRKKYEMAVSLNHLDVHNYSTHAYCLKILNNLYGI